MQQHAKRLRSQSPAGASLATPCASHTRVRERERDSRVPSHPDDADAHLVALGRSIVEEKTVLDAAVEASRARLRETRAALLACLDARCCELAASIDAAAFAKSAALDRELIAVEAALEQHRRVIHGGAVAADVGSPALPAAVVEPPVVDLRVDVAALMAAIAVFGRVLSPRAVTADDLVPSVPHVARPGRELHVYLSLGTASVAESTEELEVSLGRLVGTTRLGASVFAAGAEELPLSARLFADAHQRRLVACLALPPSGADEVCVSSFEVAGRAVAWHPRRVPVSSCMTTPLLLPVSPFSDESAVPCITAGGELYAPPGGGPEVLVFDGDGLRRPGLSLDRLGMSRWTSWSAYAANGGGVHGAEPTPVVLLGEGPSRCPGKLVAVGLLHQAPLWDQRAADAGSLWGVTVLPSQGVVVVNRQTELCALSLADGRLMARCPVAGALRGGIAACATMGWVFCDSRDAGPVAAWAWEADKNGLAPVGAVSAAGQSRGGCVLAVVPPPSRSKQRSHLVVGSHGSPVLRVVSIPDLALVHTHTLEGMMVVGLAADPSGAALAVVSETGYANTWIHVLAWPLPGMPPTC